MSNSKFKIQNSKIQFKIKNFLIGLAKEVKAHKVVYLILFFILAFSTLFRLYRLNHLLGFWYDQGRDALVVWDLIHYGKFFLIGPVTGIEGLFLGPFYYYLLAPFYWLGQGSPVMAAAGLAWLTVGAIFLIYLLGKEIYNREVGLLAAFLYGFSYQQVIFSRWLANPNPLPFFTLLVLIFLYQFIQSHNYKFLILSSFFIGLCLQLEAASAVFFLPAVLFILLWQGKNLKAKWLFFSFLAFFITLLPQIYFDFRHEGVLRSAFRKFLLEEKSFKLSILEVIHLRLLTYYDVFMGKLVVSGGGVRFFPLALFSASMFVFRKKLFKQGGKMLAIWLFVPLLGYFFYQGNHGYVWDYYFTGIMPAFFILFSAGMYYLFRKNLMGKALVSFFMILFLSS
ncbi:MAG: ArnT family glycosyltransferase, partial [Microgenomates group bacterium]